MAMKVAHFVGLFDRLLGGSLHADDDKLEKLLRSAASHDGLSAAPQGLADRIAAAARSEPRRIPVGRASSSDVLDYLRRSHIVGASLASFSMGVAVAIFVFDARSTAFVQSVMTCVASAVTVGGYL